MSDQRIDKIFSQLLQELKEYAHLRSELLKLLIIERTAKVLARFFLVMVITMLLFFFLLFISLTVVEWINIYLESLLLSYLIIAIFYLVIGGLTYLFRKQLFLNPIVRIVYDIFHEEDELEPTKSQKSAEDAEKNQ